MRNFVKLARQCSFCNCLVIFAMDTGMKIDEVLQLAPILGLNGYIWAAIIIWGQVSSLFLYSAL